MTQVSTAGSNMSEKQDKVTGSHKFTRDSQLLLQESCSKHGANQAIALPSPSGSHIFESRGRAAPATQRPGGVLPAYDDGAAASGSARACRESKELRRRLVRREEEDRTPSQPTDNTLRNE